MAITNLSTQYISASFQNLAQVSSSGDLYNGAGTQVTSLNVNSTYATTAGSAAVITGIDITSLATTGSNIFKDNQTIQGDVVITGNLTANQYVVSSSVYVVTQSFSSGSTVFGNDSLDTHQFTGSIQVQGSITGSLLGTASNAALLNSQAASYYTNASNINAGTISDSYLPATISSDITGNAATATSASYALTASYAANAGGTAVSASYALTAPYSGLTGTVPTWNQSTTGNAATATTASYAATASVSEAVKTQGGGSGTWYPLMQSGASTGYKIPALNSAFAFDGNTKVLTVTASFAQTASYISPTFISASAAASGFGTGGGGSAIIVADEGSTLTSAAASLNFVGNAVVASAIGNAVTVTIATGSAGGSTSPGGSTGEAQYNDGAGSFAGSPSLTFDGAGAITKINTRALSQDNANVVIINHDIRNNATAVAPSNSYALSGTQVALGISGTSLIEGQIVGVDVSGQWSKATSNTDISTGSLALVLQSAAGGAVFDAFLPGTLACVNLSSGPTSGNWAAGSSAYSQGTTLYLDASGKVVPTPTTTPGEHVRVMGHVYQNWTDGIDTFATFLFNPDGSWITL
jgi:hypothetical protein